ncbi:papain family cysteine protease [Teladorsagia circumcincta]|uniref:Papain family cysteine protease n=1 Tax=Teladorsagia circumcincta TaxID=45464 RepID=A0A2G9ULA0_TELCI|nr:papain family cysteine protease [Teladorsagia circumcincta]
MNKDDCMKGVMEFSEMSSFINTIRWKVELNPTKKYYKDMVMDPEFVSRDQYHNTVVLDESDNGDDIPERCTSQAMTFCRAAEVVVEGEIPCRYDSLLVLRDCCRPYEIPPCGWHKGEPHYDCRALYKGGTPACKRECQPGYNKNYTMDKYYGKNGYYLPNVKTIQKEIMRNGPVVAVYTVYQDFYHYSKGIYKHTAGQQTGGHAVKIIGWGEEKTGNRTIPYWIIANSWHNDWGENGYFRMIRGINDCGLERFVTAGIV